MPQSYTNLHYHLVFSTKFREPTVVPAIRPRLCDYIGGLVRGEGGTVLAIAKCGGKTVRECSRLVEPNWT